jgi:hypothetical protein
MMSGPLNGKTGEVVRWVIGLVLVALVSYFTSIGTVQTRISLVEDRQVRFGEDLKEIKADVKSILLASRRRDPERYEPEPSHETPRPPSRMFDR